MYVGEEAYIFLRQWACVCRCAGVGYGVLESERTQGKARVKQKAADRI